MTPEAWSVELLDRTAVGPGVVALTLASPPGFKARPGQFVRLRAPGLGGRHYTVSSPDSDGTFELTVDVTAGEWIADWLAAHPMGTAVEVEGPFGRTYYDSGDALAIGGGSGIGAAVGVAERADAEGDETALVAAGGPVHEARLASLAADGVPVYRVSDGLAAAIRACHTGQAAYVFGFRGFIDRVRAAVEAAGVNPDRFAYESYGTRQAGE